MSARLTHKPLADTVGIEISDMVPMAALDGETMQQHAEDDEVYRIADAVRGSIKLTDAGLGDEFFPAHLPIALLDAVFTPQLHYCRQVVPIIERYCSHFGVRRVRSDLTCLPPIEEQETLTDLVSRFDGTGQGEVQEKVVRSLYYSPGAKVLKSENVRRCAVELRKIGIETLQDAALARPEDIKCVLKPLHGIGDRTVHMFLMYSGADDFVKGDVHVCRFVAEALGKRRVSAEAAERLVRLAAYELGMAPRLLDNEIWKLKSSGRSR